MSTTVAPREQQEQLTELIIAQAGVVGVDARLARRIAFCESSNRQFDRDGQVLRGRHNPDDVGVFQINERYHLVRSQLLGYDIYSAEGNIGYAMWLIKNEGSRHWNWSRQCWTG